MVDFLQIRDSIKIPISDSQFVEYYVDELPVDAFDLEE